MDILIHILEVIGVVLGSIVLLIIIFVAFFTLWAKRKLRHLMLRLTGKKDIAGLIIIPFVNFLLEIFKVNADSASDPGDDTKAI